MPDGQVLVLGRGGDDLNEAADLGLAVEGHGEELDGGVVDVVVRGNHAQVQRGRVHVLLNADTLAVLQLCGVEEKKHLGFSFKSSRKKTQLIFVAAYCGQ